MDKNAKLVVLDLVEHDVLLPETVVDESQSLELLVLWILLDAVNLLDNIRVLGTFMVVRPNQSLHEPVNHLFNLRVLAAVPDLLHDSLHVLTLQVPFEDVLLVKLVESLQDWK